MALPGNLFTRDDTLFGICEGLGQDLGFNPLWLRLAFLPSLFFFPMATFGIYALLGLVVFTSRQLFPVAAAAPVAVSEAEPPARAEKADLPLAA